MENKGYLKKAKAEEARGLKLLIPSCRSMKNRSILTEEEKQFISKRGLNEIVNDQLKNLYQFEHSCRSSIND